MTKQVKIIVEKNEDGYTAYPIGIEGIVVGQGNTYDEALADINSAIKFHVETFENFGLSQLIDETIDDKSFNKDDAMKYYEDLKNINK
jgi:predicted RNase H-like HicB family nuclease